MIQTSLNAWWEPETCLQHHRLFCFWVNKTKPFKALLFQLHLALMNNTLTLTYVATLSSLNLMLTQRLNTQDSYRVIWWQAGFLWWTSDIYAWVMLDAHQFQVQQGSHTPRHRATVDVLSRAINLEEAMPSIRPEVRGNTLLNETSCKNSCKYRSQDHQWKLWILLSGTDKRHVELVLPVWNDTNRTVCTVQYFYCILHITVYITDKQIFFVIFKHIKKVINYHYWNSNLCKLLYY